ncbi:nucleotidyl transferase AbiEii/AbiGii toxin family protein [Acinetobacter guillouiae]|nr:nucleotidyl transferase AbiEii/AbiGii toxin family protein [Acinetobacter guillouiae]
MMSTPKSFMHLTEKDQSEIFRDYASITPNRGIEIAEKDLWVCWVLKMLFEMPNHLDMAFKGGTSLSKVFNVIDRFSEDIDITLDYRQFKAIDELHLEENQTAPKHIGSAVSRRINKKLELEVRSYAEDVVAPYLREMVAKLPRSELFKIELNEKGDAIEFTFPSIQKSDQRQGYMLQYILIEFGGRNIIEPNDIYHVTPYMADSYTDFEFPSSMVTVLSAHRTFWEKATLIHVECHRGVRQDAARLSRHWFDLMSLSNHTIGQNAIQDVNLLKDVVALKNIFFNAGYANYPKCLSGDFVLLPDDLGIRQLRVDYEKMIESNYLNDSTISFDQIIQSTQRTQDLINQVIKDHNLKA